MVVIILPCYSTTNATHYCSPRLALIDYECEQMHFLSSLECSLVNLRLIFVQMPPLILRDTTLGITVSAGIDLPLFCTAESSHACSRRVWWFCNKGRGPCVKLPQFASSDALPSQLYEGLLRASPHHRAPEGRALELRRKCRRRGRGICSILCGII